MDRHRIEFIGQMRPQTAHAVVAMPPVGETVTTRKVDVRAAESLQASGG